MRNSLDQFEISKRLVNSLRENNIRTIEGLSRQREEDIRMLNGIGDMGIEEALDVIRIYKQLRRWKTTQNS